MSSTDEDQVYSDEDGDGNVDSEDFNNVQRHRERQFSDTTVSSNPDTSDSEPPFCDGGNEAGAGGDAPGGQDDEEAVPPALDRRRAEVLDDDELDVYVRDMCLEQMGRNCSDAMANFFFDYAWKNAAKLFRLKMEREQRDLPDPNIATLRRKIMSSSVPPIKMDFIFIDKTTGQEEKVYNKESFPRSAYPPDKYELVHQCTRVQVM